MNVVLIPYFLAANIVVEDSQPWLFGAEYTYRGTLDASLDKTHEDSVKVHLDYELKCRNHNESSLVCRTSDIQGRSSDSSLEEDINDLRQELSTPFLITFSENGVETVSLSYEKIAPLMELYQYIASMFHIGTVITEKRIPSIFDTRESSVLGDCDTSYNISTHTVPDTLTNEVLKKRNFRLQVIPYPELKPGTAIEIDKVRHTKTCSAANRGVYHTPVSSKGRMFIDSAGVFRSDAKDIGRVIEREEKQVVTNTYRQHSSIELVNVERATGCFLTFSASKTAGLEIEDDDSESDSDSDSSSESDSDSDSHSVSDERFLL